MVFICLIFSGITLVLRSPFALPSLSLRYGYKMLGAVLACNRLIVKEVCFLDKEGSGGGDFCIIRNKNEEISKFGN